MRLNQITCGIFMAAVVLLLAAPAVAQTYDLADYMMLTPGQYAVLEGGDPCVGSTWQDAVAISTKDQYTLETWYEKEGGNWVKESIDIIEITADSVLFHGEYEMSPSEQGFWLMDPPIAIPRILALNQPVVNQGVITHESTSIPYAHSLMITEAGVTVTTPDGIFSNCLKIIESYFEGNEAESQVIILAPGLGEIKIWTAAVSDDGGDSAHLENGITELINHGSF
jgi:hypothetical protein